MKIEIGKRYVNKTWKYLVPCVAGHGDAFTRMFNNVFKLCTGIFDMNCGGQYKGRNIFVLVDNAYRKHYVDRFVNYLDKQHYFKGTYTFGPDTRTRKQMIVIEVPEQYRKSYDMFVQGKYGKMYTERELKELFSEVDGYGKHMSSSQKSVADTYDVLGMKKPGMEYLRQQVYKEFGVAIDPNGFDVPPSEYDLPLKFSEEVFNYKGKDVFCPPGAVLW